MQCPECNGAGVINEPLVGTAVVATRRGKLERGWRFTWLLGKLARSEGTNASLAEALGCQPSAIQAFKNRHADKIAEIRKNLDERLAALWIAEKINRLSEYQTDVDDINQIIEQKMESGTPAPWNSHDPANDGAFTPAATDDLPVWLRVKALILRSVAEELGQLPARVQLDVGGNIVTYQIEGVNLDQV